MPLSKGKSKRAFEHNIKVEMEHGKPQNQALAIAYSMKRRKKMAKGGQIEGVHRPVEAKHLKGGMSQMGLQTRVAKELGDHPAAQEAREEAKKRAYDTIKEARNVAGGKSKRPLEGLAEGGEVPMEDRENQRPGRQPIKHPKIMKGGTFTTKLRNQEDDLEMQDAPASPAEQPPEELDEMEADKKGPMVAAFEMKKMAEGGKVDHMADYMKHSDADYNSTEAGDAVGGGLASIRHEHDTQEQARAAHGRKHPEAAKHYAEALGHYKKAEASYAKHKKGQKLAEGGMAEDEQEEEHHDSMHAAIMAKRKRMHDEIDSGAHDEDAAEMMAEGGQVDLHSEHEEEPNNEDQMSFEALKKENYNSSDLDADQPEDSNEDGDDIDKDDHDMIGSIRRKMKAKRQF